MSAQARRLARAGLLCSALVAAAMSSCGGPIPERNRLDRPDQGLRSLHVTIVSGERGTPARPLPFGVVREVTLRIEARDRNNNLLERTSDGGDYNPFVNLSVTPAVLDSLRGAPGLEVLGRAVRLRNGVADGITVRFLRGYGEVRVWAEEAGYDPIDPSDPTPPGCSDGIDNDGDGLTDFPADYGCAAPNDDSETGGSYIAGASEAIHIDSPTIDDINGPGSSSPLVNERVTITRGTLIVTRISTSGFWVTDTSRTFCPDPSAPGGMRRCANSLFAFNFRLPEGMRPCDRLSVLQGTVQEFVSTTQLGQPAWTIPAEGLWIDEARSGRCTIPDPEPLNPAELGDAQTAYEPLENTLVRAEGFDLSPNIGPRLADCAPNGTSCRFSPGASNCDFNGNGTISFDDPREGGCANTCQRTRGCSEWTNWLRFGQIAVDFRERQGLDVQRLNIAPLFAISDFDPLRPPTVTRANGAVLTGTLKQVGPNWILEPRCTQDLVLEGEPIAANASCLLPRTVTEEP